MHTVLARRSLASSPVPATVLAMVLLAACGGSLGEAPGSPLTPATPRSTPTAVPVVPGDGPGHPPGTGTLPGGGIGLPVPPGLDPTDPNLGAAQPVGPTAGLVNQHAVAVQLVRVALDGHGGVVVELRWWSGVAPCTALDSVTIDRNDDEHRIALTVIEGSAPGDLACDMLAQLKSTTVQVDGLAAGEWTISAAGDAAPVTVAIA